MVLCSPASRSPLRVPSNRRCPHVPSPSIRSNGARCPRPHPSCLPPPCPASAAGPGVRRDHDRIAGPGHRRSSRSPTSITVTNKAQQRPQVRGHQRSRRRTPTAATLHSRRSSCATRPRAARRSHPACFDQPAQRRHRAPRSSTSGLPRPGRWTSPSRRCPTATATRRIRMPRHNDTVRGAHHDHRARREPDSS